MTLKEELSNNRREFLIAADEEARDMIREYLEPIYRQMNAANPFKKQLRIRAIRNGDHGLDFVPDIKIELKSYEASCITSKFAINVLRGAQRVGKEFDIEVDEDLNSTNTFIFAMTLDD